MNSFTKALASIIFGLVAGATGAVLVWAFRKQLRIDALVVGWIVTLVGWFVSSWLSQRAQRKMFLHGLLNSARIDVINAIRSEQDWIRGVTQLGSRFQMEGYGLVQRAANAHEVQMLCLRHNEETRAALYPASEPPRNLTMVLEEYEQLFPVTKYVRWQLSFRRIRISEQYSPILTQLLRPATHATAVQEMVTRYPTDSDYSAVLEDLRVYIQNVALAEITGGEVPQREPLDPAVPIMKKRADGLLDITAHGKSWPILSYPRSGDAEPGTAAVVPGAPNVNG